jgi:glycerol transport system ATP-binding protein
MNLLPARPVPEGVQLAGGPVVKLQVPPGASAELTLGIRASALREAQRPGDVVLGGRVELAEISGSDTFVHAHTAVGDLVAQLTGVHNFELGAAINLHVSPDQVYVFDAAGDLLLAPRRSGEKH